MLAYIYKKISKTFTRNRTGNFKNVGNIANYIYEKVTQLEAETEILKQGSNEFRKSLEEVTKAIEDIATGSLSIVSDTEKIALNIAELEKTLSDNQEHIKCVTENYVNSIIKLINNLCDMAYNLRDKSMEIKMLIDIGLLIDHLDTEGYSNENLIEICRRLKITSAYVADKTGYVHYCNEAIGRGINLFEIDKSLEQLLNGADYVATPIKPRAEDGKPYKFLSVYRNDRIYELGIDLSTN